MKDLIYIPQLDFNFFTAETQRPQNPVSGSELLKKAKRFCLAGM